MANVKLAIVYYSSTGTNYQMAKWAKEGAEAKGAEVRLVRAEELAPDAAIDANPAWREHYDETKDVVPVATSNDLEWADALIFSTPTRFGVMTAQLKQFIDQQGGLWGAGKTVNKVVSGMTSAQNAHGGQEATLLSLYKVMMHWGAIIVPPGYADPVQFAAGGNPYGVSITVGDNPVEKDVEEAVKFQAKRTVEVAEKVIG